MAVQHAPNLDAVPMRAVEYKVGNRSNRRKRRPSSPCWKAYRPDPSSGFTSGREIGGLKSANEAQRDGRTSLSAVPRYRLLDVTVRRCTTNQRSSRHAAERTRSRR